MGENDYGNGFGSGWGLWLLLTEQRENQRDINDQGRSQLLALQGVEASLNHEISDTQTAVSDGFARAAIDTLNLQSAVNSCCRDIMAGQCSGFGSASSERNGISRATDNLIFQFQTANAKGQADILCAIRECCCKLGMQHQEVINALCLQTGTIVEAVRCDGDKTRSLMTDMRMTDLATENAALKSSAATQAAIAAQTEVLIKHQKCCDNGGGHHGGGRGYQVVYAQGGPPFGGGPDKG